MNKNIHNANYEFAQKQEERKKIFLDEWQRIEVRSYYPEHLVRNFFDYLEVFEQRFDIFVEMMPKDYYKTFTIHYSKRYPIMNGKEIPIENFEIKDIKGLDLKCFLLLKLSGTFATKSSVGRYCAYSSKFPLFCNLNNSDDFYDFCDFNEILDPILALLVGKLPSVVYDKSKGVLIPYSPFKDIDENELTLHDIFTKCLKDFINRFVENCNDFCSEGDEDYGWNSVVI